MTFLGQITNFTIFRAHIRTRVLIEQGFGQTKRRFHSLHGELRVSPMKACRVATACAVLHNICKDMGLPDVDDTNAPRDNNVNGNNIFINQQDTAMRAHITQTYFS